MSSVEFSSGGGQSLKPRFRVLPASAMGFCFGVRDALTMARGVEDPEGVSIYGELVHNETILSELADRGFHQVGESERASATLRPRVLITAHGISETERARLEGLGHELIDSTCPLVRRAHDAAKRLDEDDRHVFVIGRKDHVEVRGLTGDLRRFSVIESAADIVPVHHPRLGIVAQTTTPTERVAALTAKISALHPTASIRSLATVCEPTRRRQTAVRELLRQADYVIVVGGKRSNNSQALKQRCDRAGVPARVVQGPDDLRAEDFPKSVSVVGLTAGTSTPDAALVAVMKRLEALASPVAAV